MENSSLNWRNLNVLVTGGASFIGSRLTEMLVERGARVRVADNLSSGRLANIQPLVERGSVEFLQTDLREIEAARAAMHDMEVVFHLACDHGGRGYIDTHQSSCSTNLILDGAVILAAHREGISKFVLASSGCVYPMSLQADANAEVYLHEDSVKPPYDSDNLYGWAKLMAELTLRAYHEEHGLPSAICRYFTVYGPRGNEGHAVHALIARAYLHQDPFEIWGDGTQVRNWTYIDDVVKGTILAAENISDATAINLGTEERVTVLEAAQRICAGFEHNPQFRFLRDMPVGPLNRVADNTRAKDLLGWEPKVAFAEGISHTIQWYRDTYTTEQVGKNLPRLLLERA